MVINSFNSISNFNTNTEILIVGTMTPPNGIKNVYFYSSKYNNLYNKLDKIYNSLFNGKQVISESFVTLKNELMEKEVVEKSLIINNIQTKIEDKHFAFFDVIKSCERRYEQSYLDKDLINITYDKETYFKNKKNLKLIIFTSKNAMVLFNKYIDPDNNILTTKLNIFRRKDNTDKVIKVIKKKVYIKKYIDNLKNLITSNQWYLRRLIWEQLMQFFMLKKY